MSNLFKLKRIIFHGVPQTPYMLKKLPQDNYLTYICPLKYSIAEDNGQITEEFTEYSTLGNEFCSQNVQDKIYKKISNLSILFECDESFICSSKFARLDMYGVFYKDKIVAITNSKKEKCIDVTLQYVMTLENFKKTFIENKRKELKNILFDYKEKIKIIEKELANIS